MTPIHKSHVSTATIRPADWYAGIRLSINRAPAGSTNTRQKRMFNSVSLNTCEAVDLALMDESLDWKVYNTDLKIDIVDSSHS